jgi:hypothetical protein
MEGDTQIYLVYIEGDDKTEGCPHPPRGSGRGWGYTDNTRHNVSVGGAREGGEGGRKGNRPEATLLK